MHYEPFYKIKQYDFIINFSYCIHIGLTYRNRVVSQDYTAVLQVLTNRPNDIQQPVWDIISQTGKKKTVHERDFFF